MILAAARKGLPDEIERRVAALTISADPAFRLTDEAGHYLAGCLCGRLVRTDSLYAPRVEVADSDLLSTDQKARMADRLAQFITDHINTVLAPLMALSAPDQLFVQDTAAATDTPPKPAADASSAPTTQTADAEAAAQTPPPPRQLSGAAKGFVWQIYEGLGTVERRFLAGQLRETTESDKPLLAKAGLRVGTETVYLPDMLKPAPIALRVCSGVCITRPSLIVARHLKAGSPLLCRTGQRISMPVSGWQRVIAGLARVLCGWIWSNVWQRLCVLLPVKACLKFLMTCSLLPVWAVMIWP